MFQTVRYTIHRCSWDGILDLQSSISRFGNLAFTVYHSQISKIYFIDCMALKLLKALFCMGISRLYAEINGSTFVCQFMVLSSIVPVKSFFNTMQYNTNILTKKLKLFILIEILTNTARKELEVNPAFNKNNVLAFPVIKFENTRGAGAP